MEIFVPLPEGLAAIAVAEGSLASPFDELGPSPLARAAAVFVQEELRRGSLGLDATVFESPEGGKMFGVLVAEDERGRLGLLRAFSGTIAGRFELPGFAPPVFDAERRSTVEIAGERIVKKLTDRARTLAGSTRWADARRSLDAIVAVQNAKRHEMHTRHRLSREERRRRRAAIETGSATLEELAQQSRADKAEARRLEEAWSRDRLPAEAEEKRHRRRYEAAERLHRMVSRALMRRIHDSYILRNARGETRTLRELFAPAEPPGGAGDCAAPKLLVAAIEKGWKPRALAEFWWGAPPPGGGRVSSAFYPSCREKCGPLLPFLLEGFDVAEPRRFAPPDAASLELRIVFEDESIIVVDKPAGLLSVPGKTSAEGDCVLTRLRRMHPNAMLAHRLDLDTSGLLVAAKSEAAYIALQNQFLRRSVQKRYVAVVDGEVKGEGGRIELDLRVDPHDRPRQIHDPLHGRRAVTDWKLLAREEAGTRVALFPLTGRTHQLRVHCAHPLGLGAAIVGDRLYGKGGEGRLLLHAEMLALVHPVSGEALRFKSPSSF